MKDFKPDKSKFKDDKGRYIVQGIFLEDRYNTDLAVYTLAGEDKDYRGRVYPSLKRLYLECGDPEEYTFATTYLYDWPHWKRLLQNKSVRSHIDEWRDELYLSLRSEGIQTLINLGVNEGSYQAAKWLADEGWIKKSRGRPSETEVQQELDRRTKLEEKFRGDFDLLEEHMGKKNG